MRSVLTFTGLLAMGGVLFLLLAPSGERSKEGVGAGPPSGEGLALAGELDPAESGPRLAEGELRRPGDEVSVGGRAVLDSALPGSDPEEPGRLIHGHVRDTFDRPVPAVRLRIEVDRIRLEAETDSSGYYRFCDVRKDPTLYPELLENSLPRGYFASSREPSGGIELPSKEGWRQLATSPDPLPTDSVCDFRVTTAAQIHGRVLGPGGVPVEGALVRFGPKLPGHGNAVTDTAGVFRGDAVHPGEGSVYVYLLPGSNDPLAESPEYEIAPGEVLMLPDIEFGQAGRALRGRIEDETGTPFAGVAVLGTASQRTLGFTRTDERGEFELHGLPAVKELYLHLGTDESWLPTGQTRFADRPSPLPVDLERAPGDLDIGTVLVKRSHPYRVRGSVLVDRARLDSSEFELECKGSIVGPTLYFDRTLPISSTGDFAWACEPPHDPLLLRFRLIPKDGSEPLVKELTLNPTPDGEEELLVSFP